MPQSSLRAEKSRLQKFMLASPVAAAAVGAASSANAAVVYFNVADTTITGPSSSLNFGNINLAGGTYDSSTSGNSFRVGWNSADPEKPSVGTVTNVQIAGDGSIFAFGASRFTDGQSINAGSATWSAAARYLDSPFGADSGWQTGSPISGYAGLRIATGPDFNYGWAALSFNDTTNQLTITGFAFESALNTPISAGAIPEPADSVLLLACGAAGLALYRRRRAEAA